MERGVIRELPNRIVTPFPHAAALHAGYDFAISRRPDFIL
jgi:hypothetical protein